MGFFSGLLQAGSILALDTLSALIAGPKPIKAQDLKNKTFASDAYGNPWPRCRGTVRLQGKVIWMTNIRTSIWKTVNGGLFGIGSQSVYFNLYSVSMFIGFGKKLGGGAANAILRIWADGKLLYNSPVSTASITGSITASVISGGQMPGSQSLLVDLAGGASLSLSPGDLIEVPGDPNFGYQVQSTVTATGSASQVAIPIWPPLRVNIAGGGALTVAGLSNGVWDLSSFDPNPHDGSHVNGGYICPPGGVDFFLGSDTQMPSPYIEKILGVGNVPGYRGLCGILIRDLQLRNYGDHPPQITAEISWDVATPQFPQIGPISGVGYGSSQIVAPFAGATAVNIINPLLNLFPYIFVYANIGPGETASTKLFRINTTTNQLEAVGDLSPITASHIVGPGAADSDGYFYFVSSVGLNAWDVFKWDGMGMTMVKFYGDGNVGDISVGDPAGIYAWDEQQSLFGTAVPLKLLSTMAVFGGLIIYDRQSLLPFGAPVGGSQNVCYGYDKNGNPLVSSQGAVTSDPGTPYGSPGINGNAITVDGNGDVWVFQRDTLAKYDTQFQSSILFSSGGLPTEYLAPPSFSRTDYNIGASVGGSGGAIVYNSFDNTIVVFGAGGTAKVDCATGNVVLTAAAIGSTILAPAVDVMGSIMVLGSSFAYRVDAATLTVTSSYIATSWGLTGITGLYDQLQDSFWISVVGSPSNQLHRLFFDRGTGAGIGRDSILSSLMDEAGYDVSQYDVSLVTAQAKTCKGIEFDRESYQQSLSTILPAWLIDAKPQDGKIVFVPRGQSSVVTIPEDDLGALGEPGSYEPRVIETIQDPMDTPESVHIKYYDTLRQDQQAEQYAKRISKPYASSLSTGKVVTSSRQQLDISLPITEDASEVKKIAELMLWDAWAGRTVWKFKLGPKYSRLTVADVITVTYKGTNYVLRIEQIDSGISGALEVTARIQDSSVYSETYIPSGNGGLGSGGLGSGGSPSTQPPQNSSPITYTISPAQPLSEFSATQIDMAAVTATFNSGAHAFYNSRSFTVSDPGAGNSQLYYVSIYDPNFTGEVLGTSSLTDFCSTTPAGAHLGQNGYIFMGTITITHDGVGVIVTSGGSPNIAQAQGFYVNSGGNTGVSVTEDVLTYATMDSRRATMHLTGSAANSAAANAYSYIDTATNSFAWIKAPAGWAADILLYDSSYIYQFITELDDPGYRLWSDPSSYKKLVVSHGYPTIHALPIMPRFRTAGSPSTVLDIPGPNPYNRYTSCGLIDQLDKGHVTNVTYGPVTLNFDSDGFVAGNLGNVQCMVNERYAGNSARERFFWAKNLGFVKWDAATLVSGARITGVYKVTNWAVHNKLVSGGGVTPSFSCGYGTGWP